jgi:hypothetical protein
LLPEVPDLAILSPLERAVIDYADALTQTPWTPAERHVSLLRAHGLDDRAIHDLCAIVAYFAFVNRIADGLGVDIESGDTAGHQQPASHTTAATTTTPGDDPPRAAPVTDATGYPL